VLGSICALKSFKVCLMKLDALALGAYRLIIISFWCISSFISMKCLSLSCFTNVRLSLCSLMPLLLCLPVFRGHWLGNVLPDFHLKPVFVSDNEMGPCKQHMVGSSFLIQFGKQCLLIWELSSLTFSVSIDRYVVISAV
jgi:hypothetical protein